MIALMPLVTLSAGSAPALTCLAPLADSSKMLMSQMKIRFPFCINLISTSFESSFIDTPMAGRRYVVSNSSLKTQPSVTAPFCVCGTLQELFQQMELRLLLLRGLEQAQPRVCHLRFCR